MAVNTAQSAHRRGKATEMWFLRKMPRITWDVHVSTDEVFEMLHTKRIFRSNTRKRQLKFLQKKA